MKEMFMANPWAFTICLLGSCLTIVLIMEVVISAVVDIVEMNTSEKGENNESEIF